MQSREHSPAPSDASASREELYKTTSEINTTISDLTLQLVKVKDDVMNLKVEKQQLQTKNAELSKENNWKYFWRKYLTLHLITVLEL